MPNELAIQLNVQTDVIAIIEILRFYQSSRIALVVDPSNTTLHHFFNLRLIKHIAGILKQDFVLITTDPKIKNLSQHLDINTATTVEGALTGQVTVMDVNLDLFFTEVSSVSAPGAKLSAGNPSHRATGAHTAASGMRSEKGTRWRLW